MAVRGHIEQHVRAQMGLTKPTRDSEAQTESFRKLEKDIIATNRVTFEREAAQKAIEMDAMKYERVGKEMTELKDKNQSLKESVWSLQFKLKEAAANPSSPDAFLEVMKVKISEYFTLKLGKKYE
jgi:hypothetical protein